MLKERNRRTRVGWYFKFHDDDECAGGGLGRNKRLPGFCRPNSPVYQRFVDLLKPRHDPGVGIQASSCN